MCFEPCKCLNVYAGFTIQRRGQCNIILTYIINLMNHKTFGFGVSEEEETIVSMCMVSVLVLVVFVAGASGNTATKSI